jgi:hypothetical protein
MIKDIITKFTSDEFIPGYESRFTRILGFDGFSYKEIEDFAGKLKTSGYDDKKIFLYKFPNYGVNNPKLYRKTLFSYLEFCEEIFNKSFADDEIVLLYDIGNFIHNDALRIATKEDMRFVNWYLSYQLSKIPVAIFQKSEDFKQIFPTNNIVFDTLDEVEPALTDCFNDISKAIEEMQGR